MATQARERVRHYEHEQMGYNYRLSNLLAAVGRGQLRVLEERIAARRRVCQRYEAKLRQLPGISFMPEAPTGRATRWLTALTVDPQQAEVTAGQLIDVGAGKHRGAPGLEADAPPAAVCRVPLLPASARAERLR